MRKIFLLFTLIILLINCKQSESKKEGTIDSSNKQTDKEKQIESSVFLEYYFGMTPLEFDLKSQELANKGIIQIVDSKTFLYDLDLGNDFEKAIGIIMPYYFENKLFNLIVSFESNSELSSSLITIKLKKILIDKYGDDFKSNYNALREKDDFFWKSNSKLISLKEGISNVAIEYLDTDADQKRKEFERQIERKKIEKVKNDL